MYSVVKGSLNDVIAEVRASTDNAWLLERFDELVAATSRLLDYWWPTAEANGWRVGYWAGRSPHLAVTLERDVPEGTATLRLSLHGNSYRHPLQEPRDYKPFESAEITRMLSICPPWARSAAWDASLDELARRRIDATFGVFDHTLWDAYWKKGTWWLTETELARGVSASLDAGPFTSGPNAIAALLAIEPAIERPRWRVCPDPAAVFAP